MSGLAARQRRLGCGRIGTEWASAPEVARAWLFCCSLQRIISHRGLVLRGIPGPPTARRAKEQPGRSLFFAVFVEKHQRPQRYSYR